jgi:hypothetical protein
MRYKSLFIVMGLPLCAGHPFARPAQGADASDPVARVHGTVTDDAGSPLPGVKVFALAKVFLDHPWREILANDSAETSDSGTYVLPDLPVAPDGLGGTSYYLSFAKAGYRVDPGSARLPPLNPGDDIKLDTRLERILGLTVSLRLSGDPSASAAGAKVAAGPQGPASAFAFAIPDGKNRYRFPDLYAGTQSITVSLDGYGTVVATKALSAALPDDSLEVALEPVSPASVRILDGRLTPYGTGARSLDTVVFSSASGGAALTLFAIADSSRRFSIRNIPAACAAGTLSAGPVRQAVTLTGPVTTVEVQTVFPTSLPGPVPHAKGNGSLPRSGILRFENASGKAFDARGRAYPVGPLGDRRTPSRP